jgi:hypothetical protein
MKEAATQSVREATGKAWAPASDRLSEDQASHMSYMSKFVAAFVVLLLMAPVVSWELFLFVVMRDPSGLSTEGGRLHLWLAAIASITACIAGGMMFHFFLRREKNKWSKVAMTPPGPLLAALGTEPSTNLRTSVPFDPLRWALANPWLPEGQADDRTPMDGSVRDIHGTSSEQRAFARRSHQLMFKKWSQERRD